MKIFVTPTFADIQGRVPLHLFNQLTETLRYHPAGYQHSKAFVEHKWDGYVSLLRVRQYSLIFPAGLLHHVIALIERADLPYEMIPIDLNKLEPEPVIRLADGKELYEDQRRALTCALEHQRGLLALATNFGKTELAGGILASLPGRKGLVVVNRRALLTQTAARLERLLGEPVGQLGAGRRPGRSRVTVAMIQTLYKQYRKHRREKASGPPKILDEAQVLLVDEVHTVSYKTWFPVLGSCRAPFRIGMSGTVKEVHSLLPVEAFFGPVLMEVGEAQLVSAGRSAEPTIIMPASGAVVQETRDYGRLYMEGIVRNPQRNDLLTRAVRWAADRRLRCLVLFYRIEHGEALQALFSQAGIRAALLHGKTPPEAIEGAKRDLTERRLDAVVASTIFNVGVDLPAVEVLVNAAAWKSPLATHQKLGRALRRKLEGENRALVIDPWDYGASLLKKHSEARDRLYRRLGFPALRGNLDALLSSLTMTSP